MHKKNRHYSFSAIACALVLCSNFSSCQRKSCQKALIKPAHITQAQEFSRSLDAAEDWFVVQRGSRPIIITAPHAAPVPRNGSTHVDKHTGALAHLLHKLCDVTVVYTCGSPLYDPNRHDDNRFKEAVSDLIATERPILIIDLHRAHSYRPFDVDFGTLGGISAPKHLITTLRKHLKYEGLSNFSQDYFPAAKNQTLTKWARERGITAIQLEINRVWLDLDGDLMAQHRFAQLLQGLTRFLLKLDQ